MSNRAKELDFFKVKAKIVQYQGRKRRHFCEQSLRNQYFPSCAVSFKCVNIFLSLHKRPTFLLLKSFLSLFSTSFPFFLSTLTFLLSLYLWLSSHSYFLYSFPATLNLPWHNFLVFSYLTKPLTDIRMVIRQPSSWKSDHNIEKTSMLSYAIIFIVNAHLHISGL